MSPTKVIVTLALLAVAQRAHALATSSSVTVSSVEGLELTADSRGAGAARQPHHHNDRSTLVLPQQASQKSPLQSRQFGDMINDVQIECNSDNIVVTLNTHHGFNGMIYPKGLSKNSTCMMEYHQTSANITYLLPLRSCNTMSSDVEDGVEYFNTVMVQPHRRLVTNQGRGYHIRCRYQTKERTITNHDQQLNVNLTQSTPSVIGAATMPSCTMKIFAANDLSREVMAENVRIGDELHLVISLDEQDVYGMLVTNCLVRDGMNWGEQPLLDDYGCPVDEEIMPQFVYAHNLTRASVTFQAHKFPYTSSVYYQCNVRLCFREGGCQHVPPNCNGDQRRASGGGGGNGLYQPNYRSVDGNNIDAPRRQKRWVDAGELDGVASEDVREPARNAPDAKHMSIEVFSGLHVDETSELAAAAAANAGDKDPMMMASTAEDPATSSVEPSPTSASKPAQQRQSERDFCLSLRKFAMLISLASLLLMIAIIVLIACFIHRRKRQRLEEYQRQTANTIYDNHHSYSNSPHVNRAYMRD